MTSFITILCGPTASGKSARALDIAQTQSGVIINADALQVYKDLHILTARPSAEEMARIPHRLYGVLSGHESCSAARWLTLAQEAINEAFAARQHPVVTGGTGLYIKTLMEGLSPIPDVPEETRIKATQLWQERGNAALAELDPALHVKLKAGDTQRHIRALEVALATGKPLSWWQAQPRIIPYPDAEFKIERIDVPRTELYARCEARFLTMIESGAIEEVKSLLAQHLPDTLPVMRAVGVPELAGYIEKKWSLDEAIHKAQQATRNYAKRQMTWFRNQLG